MEKDVINAQLAIIHLFPALLIVLNALKDIILMLKELLSAEYTNLESLLIISELGVTNPHLILIHLLPVLPHALNAQLVIILIWKDLLNAYLVHFGSYKNKYITGCSKCSVGYYSSEPGSTTCFKCPENYYSGNIGSINCKKCPAGTCSKSGSSSCYYCWINLLIKND